MLIFNAFVRIDQALACSGRRRGRCVCHRRRPAIEARPRIARSRPSRFAMKRFGRPA